jgi:hypothetical protein
LQAKQASHGLNLPEAHDPVCHQEKSKESQNNAIGMMKSKSNLEIEL